MDLKRMENGKVFVWMNLLGFDKDQPDKGASQFLSEAGFLPDGCVGLICHPDFVHNHRGMEEEYVLYRDNCSYNGVPRNNTRERQDWTNYDLRQLCKELEDAGSGLYVSLFGVDTLNACHDEWIYHHPELMAHFLGKDSIAKGHHFLLKRFADGTYYEDFFIEKTCQMLADYGAKGVHLADGLCHVGASSRINIFDFSTDFVDQFLTHTGITPPAEVAASMGSDEFAAEKLRADWINDNYRLEWTQFHEFRWNQFFQKFCARVHALGKEVMVLGMYCTDPFETYYSFGLNLKGIVNAGVDCITANILPASGTLVRGAEYRHVFHRYMAIAPTTAAFLPKGHLVSMLSVQDATEEWNAIHHIPCMHERDIYTMMTYRLIDGDGISRALDGYFLCLGDGMTKDDWAWERKRLSQAMEADAEALACPAMLWSDTAFDNMLPEYLRNFRWTAPKLYYELAMAGVHCGGMVRSEGLGNYSGTLVVPNFDLLSPEEQKQIARYDRGAVFCTASPDFQPEAYGITPEICIRDGFSAYPMTAFAFGCKVSDAARTKVAELISVDDGTPDTTAEDVRANVGSSIVDTLSYAKVTQGFREAMALIFQEVSDSPFKVDHEHLLLKLKNGAYRMILINKEVLTYPRAQVSCRYPVRDVKIVTDFPILPPKFVNSFDSNATRGHIFPESDPRARQNFVIKMPPGGVTVLDIYCD